MAACLRRKSNRVKKEIETRTFLLRFELVWYIFWIRSRQLGLILLGFTSNTGKRKPHQGGAQGFRSEQLMSPSLHTRAVPYAEQKRQVQLNLAPSFCARCQYRRRRGSLKGLRISLLKEAHSVPGSLGPRVDPASRPLFCPLPRSFKGCPSAGVSAGPGHCLLALK